MQHVVNWHQGNVSIQKHITSTCSLFTPWNETTRRCLCKGGGKEVSIFISLCCYHIHHLSESSTHLKKYVTNLQFRLHTKAKPEQLEGFFAEWNKYLIHVERIGREKQLVDAALIDSAPQQHGSNSNQTIKRKKGFGRDVSADVAFNDEQKEQLQKLREEAINSAKK